MYMTYFKEILGLIDTHRVLSKKTWHTHVALHALYLPVQLMLIRSKRETRLKYIEFSLKKNGKTLINVRRTTKKLRLLDNQKFFIKREKMTQVNLEPTSI